MRFNTLSIQSFLPDKQIQGEFSATHRLQKQSYATHSLTWCLLLCGLGAAPVGSSARTEPLGSPLEWGKNEGDVVSFLSIGGSLLPDQFQAADNRFLCRGLTQQLKLFCLALIQLTQRCSLEEWKFTRLFLLPTPTLSIQYCIIKVTWDHQLDWPSKGI